jgi:hypothetical protein
LGGGAERRPFGLRSRLGMILRSVGRREGERVREERRLFVGAIHGVGPRRPIWCTLRVGARCVSSEELRRDAYPGGLLFCTLRVCFRYQVVLWTQARAVCFAFRFLRVGFEFRPFLSYSFLFSFCTATRMRVRSYCCTLVRTLPVFLRGNFSHKGGLRACFAADPLSFLSRFHHSHPIL